MGDCGEFFVALTSAMVLASSICQFFGFFTPYWACSYSSGELSSNGRCQMRGLYFTCPESDSCYSDVPDGDILGLALTSFLLNVPCTLAILYISRKQLIHRGELHWNTARGFATGIFMFGEFLTGIAAILVFIRFDEIGWSSVLFCTAGILVFWTVALVVGCAVVVICGAAKD